MNRYPVETHVVCPCCGAIYDIRAQWFRSGEDRCYACAGCERICDGDVWNTVSPNNPHHDHMTTLPALALDRIATAAPLLITEEPPLTGLDHNTGRTQQEMF